MPWDTFENMCFFALIRIVFRNNNFPLRMSTYVSFTFIHWIVFACTFCCVAMENVEHVDARFLWNVQMPSETKIAKNQCPWLAFTKPFHPMHCFYSICIVASHQKEFESKPFPTFFFFRCHVVFFGCFQKCSHKFPFSAVSTSYGLWCDFIIRSMNTHI